MEKDELFRIIGANIKYYRNKYNNEVAPMTQEILAEKANVSTSLIRSLESNKTNKGISIKNLYRISVILNVKINLLFEGVNNENK